MAVAVRAVGGAVRRNRIRRVIRESFRLHQDALPPADIVVSARARTKEAGNAEMFASLNRLWGQIRIS
jgi:ribonuclease P protein component